jgi:predicted SnoaL-like aldol condensation-catalyzing enzyme
MGKDKEELGHKVSRMALQGGKTEVVVGDCCRLVDKQVVEHTEAVLQSAVAHSKVLIGLLE